MPRNIALAATAAKYSIVSLGLATFAAVTIAATLPSSAYARVTNATPPKDTSNCLKIITRQGSFLKCGNVTYVLPSRIKRPNAD